MDFKIVAISGCLSEHSVSSGLVRAALLHKNLHLNVEVADISGFPLMNPDIIGEVGFPAEVAKVREMVSRADGVIVSFPDHNSLISATMKNAYDWISIKWNDQCPIQGKPFGMMTTSSNGTKKAQQNFKRVGKYCQIKIMEECINIQGSEPGVADSNGNITSSTILQQVQDFMNSFYQFIQNSK